MINPKILTKTTFDELKVGDWYTDSTKCSYYIKRRNADVTDPNGWGRGEFLGLPYTYEYYDSDVVYRIDHITVIRQLDLQLGMAPRIWELPTSLKHREGVRLPCNYEININFL